MQSDPETDENELFDEYRWNLLYRKRQEIQVADAFRTFREHGIEPILFKGWALTPYFPESKARVASDIDLAVPSVSYDKATELVRPAARRKLFIDVHREFKHLDTTDWTLLFDESQLVSADGENVRLLRPEDHLRVVCVHWLNDGGEYRDRLWDIYYLVANRLPDFDWDRCLDVVSAERRRWIECSLGIASKYLGLDLSHTPMPNAAQNIPSWLTRSIERNWASDVRLEPLHMHLRNPRAFLRQLRKRTPPNPIEATIECEGSFDSKTRIGYQAKSYWHRMVPAIRKTFS